jgi:predicted transcriptional regulator
MPGVFRATSRRVVLTMVEGFPVVTNQEEMLVVGYVTREMIIKALTKARTQLGLGDTCRVFFTNDIPVSRDAPLFDIR